MSDSCHDNKPETLGLVQNKHLKVLSLHWNFSSGGVAKYALLIDNVRDHANIQLRSFCVLNRKRHVDNETLQKLNDRVIVWRTGFRDLKWLWKLKLEVRNWKPDIVITHGFNGHFIALLLSFITKPSFRPVCSYHGEYHATDPGRRLRSVVFNEFTYYYIRKKACGVVAVAEYSKKHLVRKGVDPSKMVVIHNGIENIRLDNQARQRIRQELNIKDDEILIGVVSRLEQVKGIEYLIEAFSLLELPHQHIRLIIIGTGTQENALRNKATLCGRAGSVTFAGFRPDTAACLEAIDLFVLPSLAESHSIGLLEAMRAGKPIIATDVGGNTESVRHEREAIVIPPANAGAIVQAINRLVTEDAFCKHIGKAARQRYLEHFTVERIVEKTAAWMLGNDINQS